MAAVRIIKLSSVGLWLFAALVAFQVRAGGSGLNIVVIVNQNSSNSCELANYYYEQHQVPAENVLRIPWQGGNITWSSAEFQSTLLDPLQAMLAARQLSNQIDYLVLSMDIPFETVNGTAVNSTTSRPSTDDSVPSSMPKGATHSPLTGGSNPGTAGLGDSTPT